MSWQNLDLPCVGTILQMPITYSDGDFAWIGFGPFFACGPQIIIQIRDNTTGNIHLTTEVAGDPLWTGGADTDATSHTCPGTPAFNAQWEEPFLFDYNGPSPGVANCTLFELTEI